MTCNYCGARNGDGEHRCQKCGRRPSDTLNTHTYRMAGALATKLQPVESPAPKERAAAITAPANLSGAVQRNLFQERGNVIPFEQFAPAAPAPAKPRAKAAAKTGHRRAPKVVEGQGSLDFLPAAPPKPRTLGTTVDSVIFCEAPVATALHRAVAAALDWGVVLAAYAMFVGVVYAIMGGLPMDKLGMMLLGGSLLLIAMTYGLFWAVANRETPGMRWMHLRLTTFDGFSPDLRQRMARFAGSCLSFCTIVGLLWSLADEESLAWQDHISGTFPTPRGFDTQILQRR